MIRPHDLPACRRDTDAEPLFHDALKVLCLKAAMYELTGGDEQAAELLVSALVG
ncbi:MAG: hypothetical protein ACRDS1_16470 [Pseudonocardiaceae bacterium]